MLFNIGDLVTRKSHNNDVVFEILKIEDRIAYLKGKDIRLYADSYIDDLVLTGIRQENEIDEKIRIDKKKEDDYFYIPGLILHLDSDKDYLTKCENYYKK